MILAKEITKWDVEIQQCNHTYLMNEAMSKIYGYFKNHNSKDFMMFKTPIRFDKRYRMFKTIKTGLKLKDTE